MKSILQKLIQTREAAVKIAVFGTALIAGIGMLSDEPFWRSFGSIWAFCFAFGCVSVGLGSFCSFLISLLTGNFKVMWRSAGWFIVCVVMYYVFAATFYALRPSSGN